jgi:hypothetical protein
MLIINVALMQDKIQGLLEENGYSFVKKQGLKMYFTAKTDDKDTEAREVKDLIKKSSFGAALFFNVEHD